MVPDEWSPGALPPDGAAFPWHLVDLVWRYFQWDQEHQGIEWAIPGSEAQLGTLVNHAYQASLRSEEMRPVRLQILFDPRPSQLTARFERPLDWSVGALVKLSPTIGIGPRWLVVAPAGGGETAELQIVGITDPDLSPHVTRAGLLTRWVEGMGVHIPPVTGVAVTVFGPAWLRISTWAQRFFELRDCTIRFPFTIHEVEPVRRWYERAVLGLGSTEKTLGVALVRRIFGGVISRIRDERHGGSLLVVPAGTDLARLPLRLHYPLGSPRLSQVLAARLGLEPMLSQHVHGKADIDLEVLDQAHFLERDVERAMDLVASLASVDGAVVLRPDLTLEGFGAEILSAAAPGAEERVPYGPSFVVRDRVDRPLSSFGMRHRSAYRFCQEVEDALAFVVSQDGDVRIFSRQGDLVFLYEGASPEDWVLER